MKRRNYKSRKNFKLIIILIFIVFVCVLFATDKLIRPIVTAAATNKAEIIINKAANDAVNKILNQTQIRYDDISVITYDKDNLISSVQIDTVKLNSIKSSVTNAIIKEVKKQEKTNVSIPLGTLLDNEYFLGRGPRVNFSLDLSVSATTDYKSVFKKAGINNTIHQIIIEVDSQYHIMLPWYQRREDYVTSFILAQTVIVGKVPDNFTSVFDDEGDIVGDIFDYGTIND